MIAIEFGVLLCDTWGFAEQPTVDVALGEEVVLDPGLLATVKHRTFGIRDEERVAYYSVLNQARNTSVSRQSSAARDFETTRLGRYLRQRNKSKEEFSVFVDLFQHPESYKGRPVKLAGNIRRLVSIPAGENLYGLETLYEAWLFADDSQNNPAVIVCSSIPSEMPTGDNLSEPGRVTGYFFKMYAYRAQDTTRVAPLILAHKLDWQPVDSSEKSEILSLLGLLVVLSAVLAGCGFMLRSARRDRRFRADRIRRDEEYQDLDCERPSSNEEF